MVTAQPQIRPVFGVPLHEALAVSQIAELPAVVYRCIEYLEAKEAEKEEGIYRLSGSSAVIKALKDRFNTEGDVDLMREGETVDPHAIAGLLKVRCLSLTHPVGPLLMEGHAELPSRAYNESSHARAPYEFPRCHWSVSLPL